MAFHLLPSSHPRVLQHSRVRSSINILLFLQTATGLITRVRVQYGLSLSVFTSSPFFLYHTTCKSIIQKVPHFFFECSGSADFLFFFTQPCFLSFQLSLTLLVLYRCSCIFSLRGLVPLSSILVLMIYSLFPFAVLRQYPPDWGRIGSLTGISYPLCSFLFPYAEVLALCASLATTTQISLDFFSFCYLDVSVHRVFFPTFVVFGFSPFGYPLFCVSLEAFRFPFVLFYFYPSFLSTFPFDYFSPFLSSFSLYSLSSLYPLYPSL